MHENIVTTLRHADYETINDEQPNYDEVPELQGVWATGKTLEECCKNLIEGVDDWLSVKSVRGLAIPATGQTQNSIPQEIAVV